MAIYRKPAWEIEQQLMESARLREEVAKYGTPDFASSLGMASLQNVEAQLQDELRAAEMIEDGYDAELAIDGDPVQDHTVDTRFLGQFLVLLQDLANALAQTLVQDTASTGRFKDNLIAANRLRVAPGFASSYGARLKLPESQSSLDFVDLPSILAIDLVYQLLIGEGQPDILPEVVIHDRVRRHYAAMVNLIGKSGATVKFRTRQNPLSAKITAPEARDRAEWLKLLRDDVKQRTINGILSGGSLEYNHFELKAEGEILTGSVSEEAARKMLLLPFGTPVTADIAITTTTHEETDAQTKVVYYLRDVRRQSDPILFTDLP